MAMNIQNLLLLILLLETLHPESWMHARDAAWIGAPTSCCTSVLRLSRPEEEFPFACLHLAMGVILRAWQVQRLDKRDGPDTSA